MAYTSDYSYRCIGWFYIEPVRSRVTLVYVSLWVATKDGAKRDEINFDNFDDEWRQLCSSLLDFA